VVRHITGYFVPPITARAEAPHEYSADLYPAHACGAATRVMSDPGLETQHR
jgi:hypothetical protein